MRRFGVTAVILVAVLGSDAVYAQNDNPPQITAVGLQIARYLGGREQVVGYDYEFLFDLYTVLPEYWDAPTAFNPAAEIAREYDVILVSLLVNDDDLPDEEFFMEVRAFVNSVGPPEAPPLYGTTLGYRLPPGGAPPLVGATEVQIDFILGISRILGPNQARLRGDIDFDVSYSVRMRVANEEEPQDPEQGEVPSWTEAVFGFAAVQNSALRPPNAPPFADAGPDQAVVLDPDTGQVLVTLDGRETFEAYNVGFDPLDDENIFEKDRLQFTWEWLSGPVEILPDAIVADSVDPALAYVTLDVPSPPDYVFRLLVKDLYNAEPSLDTVSIDVRATGPVNNAPVAVVAGPVDAVPVGAEVTLNGAGSYDPDPGDSENLVYSWRQTNEVGGELSADQLQVGFQPIGNANTSVASWRATAEGTYYFRLLVHDQPELRDLILAGASLTDTATVTVIVAGSAIDNGTMSDITSGGRNGALGGLPAGAGCGAGLLPLAVLPVLLCLMRGRVR